MRGALVLLCGLFAVLGCGRGEWRKPLPPAASSSSSVPRPAEEPALCPGGLLCESRTLLMGWRVPVGCRTSVNGRYVAACYLPDAAWPKVVEFFQSRYPSALLVPGGLQVTQSQPALDLRVNAVPPQAKGAKPPKPPALLEPALSVRRRPTGIELVAVAGDAVPQAQR